MREGEDDESSFVGVIFVFNLRLPFSQLFRSCLIRQDERIGVGVTVEFLKIRNRPGHMELGIVFCHCEK